MLDAIARDFRRVAPACDSWSLRIVDETTEWLAVERGVVRPPRSGRELGAMVKVRCGTGEGYAATGDLSAAGLRAAGQRASAWARRAADISLPGMVAGAAGPGPPSRAARGRYRSPVRQPWAAVPLSEKIERLRAACDALQQGDRIVDRVAQLWWTGSRTLRIDSEGGELEQEFSFLLPMLQASANEGSETQTRTLGGHACARQAGLELLDEIGFDSAPERIADQALELVAARDCPSGTMDLVLAPDQMILQLHESIGHPLELDRILGDERNYAGTSFVTLDMFGSYRYGSELLDVTFDPSVEGQLASYAFDDDGSPAERCHVIEGGLLMRPLGSASSQHRAGLPGVANARAESWNRPPIDRMANLNLEPGRDSLQQLISRVEHGVYMETNASWSIDDSRNKFQFGCEWARLIEKGELGAVLKKPNYRGVSATFWRSLAGVGDAASREVLGTPYCGKGEPNQVIRVGHASPPCLFENVEVFGGDAA